MLTNAPPLAAAERSLAVKEQRNYFLFRRMADGTIQRVSVHSVPFQRDGRILLLSLIQPVLAERQPADESALYQQRLEAQVDAQTREIEASKRQQRYVLAQSCCCRLASSRICYTRCAEAGR